MEVLTPSRSAASTPYICTMFACSRLFTRFRRKDNLVEPKYLPVVRELKEWIFNDTERQRRFDEAVALAYSYNIIELQDVRCLEDYFRFLNNLLLWVPSETVQGKNIIHQHCKIYFVLDQPSILPYQSPISSSSGATEPLTWLSAWLVRYNREIGIFMDSAASLNTASLATIRASPAYHMDDYLEPRGGWNSFNHFFARNVKPGRRPIAAIADDSVLASPADFTYNGHLQVSATSTITFKTLTWRISELLADSPLGARFAGGTWIHGFLDASDYHRVHTPVAGKVVEARVIQGQHYCFIQARDVADGGFEEEGIEEDVIEEKRKMLMAERPVKYLKKRRSEFDVPNEHGYQFVQARGLIILDTQIGLVAVLPVGMAAVSSVVLTAEVGASLHKGEELGYFQFGGSDVVVLFEARKRVDVSMVVGQHYNMGMEIGRVK